MMEDEAVLQKEIFLPLKMITASICWKS